ncbi:MAG: putative dienelactone hydrolase [Bradymonadia bacterium]|jgi:predicted dienelactone hydrolase
MPCVESERSFFLFQTVFRMKVHPTSAPLVSVLAALALAAGCSDASPGQEDASAADVSDDAPQTDADAADVSVDGEGPDVSVDAADNSLSADAVDASVSADAEDANLDVGAGTPVNSGEPDIDLETVSGHQVVELTYVVPGLEEERTLDVRMWYATDDEEGETTEFTLGIFTDEFAWQDANILVPRRDELMPLVVHSHGGRGFSGQISTVARQFVRNGWLVVAPSHPGHTLLDTTEPGYSFPAVRAFDVMAAIDFVENLPEDHPLSGRVDTSRVLAMGHSYGGQNAWLLGGLPLDLDGIRERCGDGCTPGDIAAFEAFSPDPRVVAGVSLENLIDSRLVLDESFADMPAPMLHISGTEGNDATGLFGRAAQANLTWISLIGGCHESPTGTLPCPTLDLQESLPTTATYAVAFGARHILGSSDPAVMSILDGSVEVSTSAVLMRSPGAP